MPFGNPILGGDTLVRDAIESENYVPGVSGWRIARNGDIDMNTGTFRGTVEVNGADNSQIAIDVLAGQPIIRLKPPDDGANSFSYGDVNVGSQVGSSFISLDAPQLSTVGHPGAFLSLVSDPNGDLFHGRDFAEFGEDILLDSVGSDGSPIDIYALSDGMRYQRGQQIFNATAVVGAAATSVVAAQVFTTAFPVGVVPMLTAPNLRNTSANSAGWFGRCTDITNTGFNMRLYGPAPGGAGFTAGAQIMIFSP